MVIVDDSAVIRKRLPSTLVVIMGIKLPSENAVPQERSCHRCAAEFPRLVRYGAAAIALACTLLDARPARAQKGATGQVEIGAFGSFTRYDLSATRLVPGLGGGGRLGVYLNRSISLEASGDYSTTHHYKGGGRVTAARIGGTLALHAPFRWDAMYLGVGYDRYFYRGDMDVPDDGVTVGDDNGLHIVFGHRFPLLGPASIGLEGRWTYFPKSMYSPTDSWGPHNAVANASVALGISVVAFGGRPRDTDRDGVADKTDRCPDTPLGAQTDPVGCPTDEDSDTVFDGLDECPETPLGASVNEVGCPSDSDSDSVFDGIDICPSTPMGAVADDNGCPLDSDEDGVFGGLDQCPDTPSGATVDTEGCPLDTDQDGVFGGIDQCDGTPLGVEVDEVGCPADQDGDRVRDSQDRCPNTAPGQKVDDVGCAVLFGLELGVARPLILQGVNFESGQFRLTPESHFVLDQIAASLLVHSDVRIEIAGHTDWTGPPQLNGQLSQSRAETVMAYLIQQGVPRERLIARGYGSENPIASNYTEFGRVQNRRVELTVLPNQ